MNTTLRIARSLKGSYMQRLMYSKLPMEFIVPRDNDIIICWHPERQFPYEHSLPLPEAKPVMSDSVLCIGEKEVSEVFRRKRESVVIEELSKMTYTTKHRWYPRSRDKKAKKTLPDRPYL